MSTEKCTSSNSPVSGLNADAVAATLALPATKTATDLPWNCADCDCTVVRQGVVPLHGTKVEKKPLICVPAWVCFNCPEIVTNAGSVQLTEPVILVAPVVRLT